MPSLRATACAVVRLSPVSITTRTPSSPSAFRAAAVVALDRIGDGDDAGRLAVDRDEDRGRAVERAIPRPGLLSPAVAMLSSARNAALPSTTRLRSDHADRALAGRLIEAHDLAQARRRAPSRRRRSPRRADARSPARRSPRSAARSASSKPIARHDRGHLRLALGERAGLVDHQRVDRSPCAPAPRRS